MPGFVIDELPRTLHRFYSEEIFARELAAHGKLRMRALSYYLIADASRRDQSEGRSHIRIPGMVPRVRVNTVTGEFTDARSQPGHFNFSGELINPTYVFCTSGPTIDLEQGRRKFGEMLVTIQDPAAFAHALFDALVVQIPEDRELLYLDGFPVRYDKGEVGVEPKRDARTRIHFGQKPAEYQDQCEYRFVAVLSGPRAGSPEHLDVRLVSDAELFAIAEEVKR